MNDFPNRNDAYRMMPGPAGQPALRGMVPDLPDTSWREPPSAAVFGGISFVHKATAIGASAAYPSPAPTGRDHGEGGHGGSSRDHRSPQDGRTLLDRMQRALYEAQHNDVWAQVKPGTGIS
jgi:hypothetical protein